MNEWRKEWMKEGANKQRTNESALSFFGIFNSLLYVKLTNSMNICAHKIWNIISFPEIWTRQQVSRRKMSHPCLHHPIAHVHGLAGYYQPKTVLLTLYRNDSIEIAEAGRMFCPKRNTSINMSIFSVMQERKHWNMSTDYGHHSHSLTIIANLNVVKTPILAHVHGRQQHAENKHIMKQSLIYFGTSWTIALAIFTEDDATAEIGLGNLEPVSTWNHIYHRIKYHASANYAGPCN